MADLIRAEGADVEARVVSGYDVLHKLRSEDRERIFDRLNSRSTADIKRDLALRTAAKARLASYQLRSGRDRRSGHERRSLVSSNLPAGERRSGSDRRSGRDRRGTQAAV
jgi:hypothetical protein